MLHLVNRGSMWTIGSLLHRRISNGSLDSLKTKNIEHMKSSASIVSELRQLALFINATHCTKHVSIHIKELVTRLTLDSCDLSVDETTHAMQSWLLMASSTSSTLSVSLSSLHKLLLSRSHFWLFSAQSQLNTVLPLHSKLRLATTLCLASTHVCTTSNESNRDIWQTYLIKSCDQSRSSGMFKRLDPNTFITFTHLLQRMAEVNKKFHGFFYLYKFLQFFDSLTSEQIALVLSTLMKHNIEPLSQSHPYRDKLASMLIKRIINNHDVIVDETRNHFERVAMKFLVQRMPTMALAEDLRELQAFYLSRDSAVTTEMLLGVLLVSVSTRSLESRFFKHIFEVRLKKEDFSELSGSRLFNPYVEISVLLRAFRMLSEKQQTMLIDRLVGQTKFRLQRREDESNSHWFELAQLGVVLASVGRYDEELFMRMFSNPLLFVAMVKKEGDEDLKRSEVKVVKRILYSKNKIDHRRTLENIKNTRTIMELDRKFNLVEMSPRLPIISEKGLKASFLPNCQWKFPLAYEDFLDLIQSTIQKELKPVSIENTSSIRGLTIDDFVIQLSENRRVTLLLLDKTRDGVFGLTPTVELIFNRVLSHKFVSIDFDESLTNEDRLLDVPVALERVQKALQELTQN